MNWIRNNTFLAGFLGVMIAGVAALGVLLFLAISHYGEVDEAYTAQAAELHRLRSLTPFPDEANLAKFQAQGAVLNDSISELLGKLINVQFPLEPTTPQQFQDKLRASINALTAKANESGVKLPADFALGFNRYQTDIPGNEAAAPLARQLAAIELVINALIVSKVDAVTAIDRTPIAEESGKKPAKTLVAKSPFTISFSAEQGRLRKLLNDVVTAKKQFYVIRTIRIKNQAEKAPSKTVAGAAGAETAAVTPDSKQKSLGYIFGAEKLDVVANFEIINFDNTQKK